MALLNAHVDLILIGHWPLQTCQNSSTIAYDALPSRIAAADIKGQNVAFVVTFSVVQLLFTVSISQVRR
jgi:hypothetical protein